MKKAPSVAGGALSGGGGLFYRVQPGDDPPLAVVIVVASAKSSFPMNGRLQIRLAHVNEKVDADTAALSGYNPRSMAATYPRFHVGDKCTSFITTCFGRHAM
jgi:hypothetical protein